MREARTPSIPCAVDDLTCIYMRDTCILVCIRVFTNSERVLWSQTTIQVVFDEKPSDLYRVGIRTERKETVGGYLIRTGVKDCVRVHRTESERLASSDRTV